MNNLLAQIPLGNIQGVGPLSTNAVASPVSPSDQMDVLISNFIGVMTMIAGLYFLVQLITSGYSWMSSGGDKQSVQTAQKKLTGAIVGLFIVVVAFALANVVSSLLGLNIRTFSLSVFQFIP